MATNASDEGCATILERGRESACAFNLTLSGLFLISEVSGFSDISVAGFAGMTQGLGIGR